MVGCCSCIRIDLTKTNDKTKEIVSELIHSFFNSQWFLVEDETIS